MKFPFSHLREDVNEPTRALNEETKSALEFEIDEVKIHLINHLEEKGTNKLFIMAISLMPSRLVVDSLDGAFDFLVSLVAESE